MKRFTKIALTIICLVFSQVTFAQTISESQAMANAQKVLSLNKPTFNSGGPRRAAATPTSQELTLAYTARKGAETYYYVFNIGNDNGFVIAGGDAVANEILAYVPQGHFNYDSIPDNVKWWLGEYEKEISTAKKLAPQLQKRNAAAPKRATQSSTTTDVRDLFTNIPDLITTKWDQGAPYNAKIPAIYHTNGDSIISPTGCVPTAIAQIMNYWQWPITGVGSYSYTLDYDGLDEWSAGVAEGSFDGLLPATFSADFGSTTYDWANMLDDYSIGSPTQAQIDAVSTLMYHIGVAEHTMYGPGGSSGGGVSAMSSLKKYFGYSDRITFMERGDYLDDEWEEIIYSELQAGRPVFYESNLHAFLLHGYSADYKMFSVNWGWGGLFDGYYRITSTDYPYFVNDENFRIDYVGHTIWINIEPNNIIHTNSFSEVGDTISINSIRYDLIGPLSKTVEVTYAGDNDPMYEGDIIIPNSIVHNNQTYIVTKIGRFAFSIGGIGMADADGNFAFGCGPAPNTITSLTLPNTIRSIAQYALRAPLVSKLVIPESVEFLAQHCCDQMNSLISIELPERLSYIPNYCFWGCQNLHILSLPENVKILGYKCFGDCSNLDVLVINADTIPTLGGRNPFGGYYKNGRTLFVPQNLIDNYRQNSEFNIWENIISNDSLPASLGVFFEVDNIQYQVLKDGVTVMGYNGTGSNADITIPANVSYNEEVFSVKKIGTGAFRGKDFRSVKIEEGIIEIQGNAFSGQYSLKSVSFPSTLKFIGSSAFEDCWQLENIELLEGITRIEGDAFRSCHALTSFQTPNSVTYLGQDVFDDCGHLELIKLSTSLSAIHPLNYTNYQIFPLKHIVLPPCVDTLYASFGHCDSLKTMICYAQTPPQLINYQIGTALPPNISTGTLYVPAEAIQTYRSTPGWQDWGTILPIVPIDSFQLVDKTIEKFKKEGINIQLFPTNATPGQIYYSSKNPQVATISSDGVITAAEVGEATITVETLDGRQATCVVTVTTPKFTITFVDEDGSILQTSEVESGQVPAYNGTTPSKQSTAQYTYAFAGWTPEVIAVTGEATYTATYSSTINSYLISFVNYDGAVLQSGNVNFGVTPSYTGATPIKPATAQYTYTFKGWDKEIVSVVGAETYTAQFDSVVNQYTITIIGENCTITGDGTYDYGTEVTLAVTPDEGYWFVQWLDGVVDAIRQILVTEDATYTAITEEQSIVTGWQSVSSSEKAQKIFDGTHYYILRGGKRYTLQGAEVK